MSSPRLVADIYPGTNGSNPQNLRVVGEVLFFTAFDGRTGRELWRSDGTGAGTRLVKDILPGLASAFPDELTAVGDALLFKALGPGTGAELWRSNGSSAGTKILTDLLPGLFSSNTSTLTAVGNSLFFSATDGKVNGLWRSDGTAAGTRLVRANLSVASKAFSVGPPFAATVNQTLYFSGNAGNTGLELWRSDGTSSGTKLVREIRPGLRGSEPQGLTAVGDTLFFTANDGSTGRELWTSDGTSQGTTLVKDILTGFLAGSPLSSEPRDLTAVGNTLFFSARDQSGGRELWRSDGTAAGTSRVADLLPGNNPSDPRELTAVGNTLFFTANGEERGRGLWKSDGTAAGTVFVTDRVPHLPFQSGSSIELTAAGHTLFFSQGELWAFDVSPYLDEVVLPPTPSLAIAAGSASQAEGRSGTTAFTFTVSRTGMLSGRSTAVWSVAGSGANPTNGEDFSGATSGTVSFAAGQASRTLTVNVRGDLLQEGDESFALTLSAPTGASLTTATASGTLFNDDLIGDADPNTLVGSARAEFLDGGANVDSLTGKGGADVFGFRLGQSPLSAPDRITDFAFGVDKIDLFAASGGALPAPVGFSRAANNASATTLSDLAAAVFADANGARAGKQALAANSAVLVRATNAAIAGTYLLINNGVAGRSDGEDLLIKLGGFSGPLPVLGAIAPGTVFV